MGISLVRHIRRKKKIIIHWQFITSRTYFYNFFIFFFSKATKKVEANFVTRRIFKDVAFISFSCTSICWKTDLQMTTNFSPCARKYKYVDTYDVCSVCLSLHMECLHCWKKWSSLNVCKIQTVSAHVVIRSGFSNTVSKNWSHTNSIRK